MIYMFLIVGFLVGWIGNDLVFTGICRMRTPIIYNVACAFIACFATYYYLVEYAQIYTIN